MVLCSTSTYLLSPYFIQQKHSNSPCRSFLIEHGKTRKSYTLSVGLDKYLSIKECMEGRWEK